MHRIFTLLPGRLADSMILIASAAADVVSGWERALEGVAGILVVRQFESLKQGLERVAPRILLLDLDLPGLDAPRGVAVLRSASPATHVIVFSAIASDDLEIALFKLGVRGCARRDIDAQLVKRIVLAIEQGEMWIRRAVTPRLLDDLRARSRDDHRSSAGSADQLTLLTQREREIVRLIGSGESNKAIARELCITERTVKAHLTGIFRKLGVADRVRLALRVASRPEHRSEQVN
jgi:two-component system NarL family response regulator